MEFYKDNEGYYVLEVDGSALVMSRVEAEELFVMIGNTLKDNDPTETEEGIE